MKKLVLVSIIGLVLSGCGGGSSNGNTNPQPETKPQDVQGTIESVDAASKQITVNGYHYDVASVMYGSNALSITDLEKNMMVQVFSGAKSGVQVQVEPTIVGMVTDINHTANTFTVNGIELVFAGLHADIEINDWVMVSSLPTATAGYKVLSVVEFEADQLGNTVEVEGRLSNLDINRNTFNLGASLTVNYTSGVIEDGATLANGQWVEVTGDMAGFDLNATEIEVEDFDGLSDGNEVEGVITWVAADTSAFELSYRGRFYVDSNTRFEDGTKSQLTQGRVVEVKSVKQGTQQVAIEVEFDDDYNDQGQWNEFELEGMVSAVDTAANTFVLGSKTIMIDANTVFEGGVTLDTLTQQRIEVDGVIMDKDYVAREIEVDND